MNSNFPKVSIIMPVYNAELYLEEAILSVLAQSYSNFEFLIVNDGSTDNSLNIINKYISLDSRIHLITRENKGLVSSLNEAISYSTGKYIARMDADDISLPDRIKKQVELMETHNIDICGCHYIIFGIDKNFGNDKKFLDCVFVPISDASIIIYLLQGVPFAHGSVMIRSSTLSDGNIRYGSNHKFAEDKSLWLELFETGAKFGNVNEILFLYRQLPSSLSFIRRKEILQDVNVINKKIINNYFNYIFLSLNELLHSKNNLSAREFEYISDTILLLLFTSNKCKYKLLTLFFKIPARFKILSIFKLIRKIP